MAAIGQPVQYKLSAQDAAEFGEQIGGVEGSTMAALIVSEPTGTPAVCNIKMQPNSSDNAKFLEARAEGTGNGEWQAF